MNIQSNKKILAVLSMALFIAMGASSFADTSSPSEGSGAATHHRHWRAMKKEVIQACAQANGITLPAKGSGDQLSSADRTTIQECAKEFHTEMQACVASAGVSKPEPGQKPSAADKAAFKQCKTQSLAKISGTS